jgi:hypothetical protein
VSPRRGRGTRTRRGLTVSGAAGSTRLTGGRATTPRRVPVFSGGRRGVVARAGGGAAAGDVVVRNGSRGVMAGGPRPAGGRRQRPASAALRSATAGHSTPHAPRRTRAKGGRGARYGWYRKMIAQQTTPGTPHNAHRQPVPAPRSPLSKSSKSGCDEYPSPIPADDLRRLRGSSFYYGETVAQALGTLRCVNGDP